ncbi:MAG: hypothetical protein U0946_03450 [Patescibacteria group bacterium]|nr:hypothetical protein [Patescibacteria group bacterium]
MNVEQAGLSEQVLTSIGSAAEAAMRTRQENRQELEDFSGLEEWKEHIVSRRLGGFVESTLNDPQNRDSLSIWAVALFFNKADPDFTLLTTWDRRDVRKLILVLQKKATEVYGQEKAGEIENIRGVDGRFDPKMLAVDVFGIAGEAIKALRKEKLLPESLREELEREKTLTVELREENSRLSRKAEVIDDIETTEEVPAPEQLKAKALEIQALRLERNWLRSSNEVLTEEEGKRLTKLNEQIPALEVEFEAVFGVVPGKNGLFSQAFYGVDDMVVREGDHGDMVSLKNELMELGISCCREGMVGTNESKLIDLYGRAKAILLNNSKEPIMDSDAFMEAFKELVTVKGMEEEAEVVQPAETAAETLPTAEVIREKVKAAAVFCFQGAEAWVNFGGESQNIALAGEAGMYSRVNEPDRKEGIGIPAAAAMDNDNTTYYHYNKNIITNSLGLSKILCC